MKDRRTSLRAPLAAAAIAAVALLALGGTAVAGHLSSGVKSYTGCLELTTPRTGPVGTIQYIAEGDAPRRACPAGYVEAHFSGGDITKISATGGLTVDGDNGEVTIGLDPQYSLPQNCTAPNNVAKWNGTAWACAADNNTTYSNGTGLSLSGTQFSVHPDYRVKNTPDCASGQFATGFDVDGDIQCQAPGSPGVEVWQKVRPAVTAGTVIVLPEGEGVDLVTMPLPAGTFLVTAVADISGREEDSVTASCRLRDGAFNLLPVHPGSVDISDGALAEASATVAINGVVSLASAGTVRFTCFSWSNDAQAESGTLTAIKVATVHTP